MKIYVAMAEMPDGSRAFGDAYKTYQKAYVASLDMIKDLKTNMQFQMSPMVEEIELMED